MNFDKNAALVEALSTALWERAEADVARNPQYHQEYGDPVVHSYELELDKLTSRLELLLDEEYATQGDIADLRSDLRDEKYPYPG